MIVFVYILCSLITFNYCYALNLPNVDEIVDNANKTAASITEEVKDSVDNVVESVNNTTKSVEKKTEDVVGNATQKAEKIGKKIIKSSSSVLRKTEKGAFNVVKGFVNGVSEVVGTPINLKQLTFYLVTAENLKNPRKIDFYNPGDIAKTKGKIYFLIHGWMASMNSSWYSDMAESLTRANPDTHVVQVNWDGPASDNYAFSAFDTESAGNFVGVLINKLVTEHQVSPRNFVLIGHSLGAQICGWAAKTFKKMSGTKLPRIIALDPAGPLFILRPDSKRLNKNDAEVVMAVHTDADKLGFPTTIGTIDFFPNGGDNQPGCWKIDLGNVSTYTEPVTCDHSRAWDYFSEAINITGSFPSRKCSNYNDFQNNKCTNETVAMGDLKTTAKGSYYLRTSSQRLYSKLYTDEANNTNTNNSSENMSQSKNE
ncbi:hypothetical protein WA026_018314 [Henosepilachna vigintioctopunctata]|uniref:Ribosome-recycling factor, mitochondrial n=1 Tax=Henosepilachna vigintioctopunctata TaxID=420089 RepID=A0AAW1VH72_9CUCU